MLPVPMSIYKRTELVHPLAPENEYVEKFSQSLNHIPKLRYSLGYDHQKRELCVSFLEVSCGGTLTVPVGISPAPDTQKPYPPFSDCTWTMIAPVGYK
ncbi:tolloid-like protein 1 isoform X3 [Xenopus tropicalis]|uniref:Tolloid-like protein 1 isoform X3 n=1 Tax=Xenopus tropicalis TaxID=8364 RepID=A0A8J1JEN6_XENTR|nr:tolloid-like protein 1 isoform X3 [Xenopus tropicalis]